MTDSVLTEGATTFTPGVSSRSGSTSTFTHAGLKNTDRQSTTTSLSATRQYDAFGNLVSSTGTWNTRFGYAGNFGYQGDDNTGLKLLGHRYYDSSTGRFLTRDPIKDGRNWYGYCGNDPLNYVDPTGLQGDWIDNFLAWGSDFFGGWGYTLTGGQIEHVWGFMGTIDYVDRSSGAFLAGTIVGEVHQVALSRKVPAKGSSMAGRGGRTGKNNGAGHNRGSHKGRGDEPLYEKSQEELREIRDQARRDGDNSTLERANRIGKERFRGWRK